MHVDIDHLRTWIGRTCVTEDRVTPVPLQALAATLDRDDPPPAAGSPIPPCWHWLYFLPLHRQSEIGSDGHPQRGSFLPPVPLPRRMWAGGQLEFLRPLEVGQSIVRRSLIEDVRMKDGRTGPLVFVTVRHEVQADGEAALVERQDIVYRGMPPPGEPLPAGTPASADAAWSRRVEPDGVLLFRYSALTFNGHRIHHDRRYAAEVEGYPGLVVHGPLIATLLLDVLRRERRQAHVKRFEFRAMKPLFDTAPFELRGRPEGDGLAKLWAVTPDGQVAMDARATLA